jgi:hypothetical protein
MGEWHRTTSVEYKPGGTMSVVDVMFKELSWERWLENSGMVNPMSSTVSCIGLHLKQSVFAFCNSNTFWIRSGKYFSRNPGGLS